VHAYVPVPTPDDLLRGQIKLGDEEYLIYRDEENGPGPGWVSDDLGTPQTMAGVSARKN